ncbi:MAG: hypothetical protein MW690_000227 [Methanophagales archaeon]|nr:hypothetical protein [Methanophagales archaeon]
MLRKVPTHTFVAPFDSSGIFEAGVKMVQEMMPELEPKSALIVDVKEIFVTSPGPDAEKRLNRNITQAENFLLCFQFPAACKGKQNRREGGESKDENRGDFRHTRQFRDD